MREVSQGQARTHVSCALTLPPSWPFLKTFGDATWRWSSHKLEDASEHVHGATEGPAEKRLWQLGPHFNESQAWPERLCCICWALALGLAGVAGNSKSPLI